MATPHFANFQALFPKFQSLSELEYLRTFDFDLYFSAPSPRPHPYFITCSFPFCAYITSSRQNIHRENSSFIQA